MRCPLLGGAQKNQPLNVANVAYNAVCSSQDIWDTTQGNAVEVMPIGGVIDTLHIVLGGAPGVGKSYTFTLMVNGSPTSLEVAISGTDTSGADDSNTATVSAGDLVELRCTPAGTPTQRNLRYYCVFDGDSAIILGHNRTDIIPDGVRYMGLMGGTRLDVSVNDQMQVCAAAGTLKNFRIKLATAPGVGKSRIFTVRLNSANQSMTVTISGNDTTGEDTSNTINVSSGDRLEILHTRSGGPTDTEGGWGFEFDPTTNGESPMMFGDDDNPQTGTTEYNSILGSTSWATTSTNSDFIAPACIFKDFYVRMENAPGAGKQFQFWLFHGNAESTLTATIAGDSDTSANDTAHDVTIVDEDTLVVKITPTGTPTTSDVYYGFVCYITPETAPGTPTSLVATADGATQIDLSWHTPVDDGGVSITGYQIERESPTGGGWSTIVANTGVVTTTYSNTGLDAVTEYNYRVSAINSVGVGTASNEDSATTTILTPSYTYEEELNFRTSIILMDDGSEIRNSYGTGKRLFTLNYDKITQANKDTLITMYNTLLGMTTAFTWTNPNDDIDYTVRFVSSPLEYTESEDEIYSIQLQLVEVI